VSPRQSKVGSFIESLVNTVAGMILAMYVTALICWAYGIQMTWRNNVIITGWMTVFSVVRGYAIRRIFNSEFWRHSGLRKSRQGQER
jgi:hypothetical protein